MTDEGVWWGPPLSGSDDDEGDNDDCGAAAAARADREACASAIATATGPCSAGLKYHPPPPAEGEADSRKSGVLPPPELGVAGAAAAAQLYASRMEATSEVTRSATHAPSPQAARTKATVRPASRMDAASPVGR